MFQVISLGYLVLQVTDALQPVIRVHNIQQEKFENANQDGFGSNQFKHVYMRTPPLQGNARSYGELTISHGYGTGPIYRKHYTFHSSNSQDDHANTGNAAKMMYVPVQLHAKYVPNEPKKSGPHAAASVVHASNSQQPTQTDTTAELAHAEHIPEQSQATFDVNQATSTDALPVEGSGVETYPKPVVAENGANVQTEEPVSIETEPLRAENEESQKEDLPLPETTPLIESTATAKDDEIESTQAARLDDTASQTNTHKTTEVTKVTYITRVRTMLFEHDFNQRRNMILFAAVISSLTVLVYSLILMCCCVRTKREPSNDPVADDQSISISQA